MTATLPKPAISRHGTSDYTPQKRQDRFQKSMQHRLKHNATTAGYVKKSVVLDKEYK
jgi:hypothetical protein